MYLEEMFVLAGLTDDNPRAAELFYAALMKRASRIFAETKMHSGEFTLAEANQLMIDSVPFMEEGPRALRPGGLSTPPRRGEQLPDWENTSRAINVRSGKAAGR